MYPQMTIIIIIIITEKAEEEIEVARWNTNIFLPCEVFTVEIKFFLLSEQFKVHRIKYGVGRDMQGSLKCSSWTYTGHPS